MTALDQLIELRRAGHVQRCHTWQHLGSYSVAEHCYQCLIILTAFHPDPSPRLLKSVLYHDSAEYVVGDTPAPAKWRSRALREALRALESEVEAELQISFELDTTEELWIKAVDLIEFGMWCIDQLDLGNSLAMPRLATVIEAFNSFQAFPPELTPVVDYIRSYGVQQ